MKQKIRESMLKKRGSSAETAKKRADKSALIAKRVLLLAEYRHASTVMAYSSIGSEVGTREIIAEALAAGKKVLLPKVARGKIVACEFEGSSTKLSKKSSEFSIPEPVNCKRVKEGTIDLVLVPGVAFDSYGHRLGYGKGFYDEFLKRTRADKIGLAFELQIVGKVPFEAHDVRMDRVATEKRVIGGY